MTLKITGTTEEITVFFLELGGTLPVLDIAEQDDGGNDWEDESND